MMFFRVLLLDEQLSRCQKTLRALRALGLQAIYQASQCDKAMKILRDIGGVNIIICELNKVNLEYFDFLKICAKEELVNAVIFWSQFDPQLERAIEHINLFSKIRPIGFIGRDPTAEQLNWILRSYIRSKSSLQLLPSAAFKVPSEREIEQGLAAGQFKAWFQPKFNLKNQSLCGVEALVRWEHPTRGLLLPRDFLSAVLVYELIDEMFKQVFCQGLDLLAILHKRGLQLQVAFNIHASQLTCSKLPDFVAATLLERKISGDAVLFEVSQNGLLNMSLATLNGLLRLQRLGCGLSIDDFGVGFSSLSLLCKLPFDQLKLDASVTQNLPDYHSKAMLISTVALAKALDMSLVIEGVSSQHIQDTVLALGGVFAQGYHLAKPMSVHRIKDWLK